MNGLLTENYILLAGNDLVADTTSETDSSVVDMANSDEVTFLVRLGDVDAAAVLTFTVKENTASSTSSPTPTAVSMTAASVAGAVTPVMTTGAAVFTESSGNLDQKLIAVTVKRQVLTKQYVFLAITATVESYEVNSLVIVKNSKELPVTQGTTVASIVKSVS